MEPGDFGSDPWDEFLARYFGRGEGGRRPAHRVDITRLMTADAREMLADAARRAAQRQSNDLDTDHLLWAALQREPLRDLVRRAGAPTPSTPGGRATGARARGRPTCRDPAQGPCSKPNSVPGDVANTSHGTLDGLPLNPESPPGGFAAAGSSPIVAGRPTPTRPDMAPSRPRHPKLDQSAASDWPDGPATR